jgi:hypothetical protein
MKQTELDDKEYRERNTKTSKWNANNLKDLAVLTNIRTR